MIALQLVEHFEGIAAPLPMIMPSLTSHLPGAVWRASIATTMHWAPKRAAERLTRPMIRRFCSGSSMPSSDVYISSAQSTCAASK